VNDVGESLNIVRDKIARACSRAGRSENEVRLVGATKGVPLGRIRAAYLEGLADFGENYVQEAKDKIESFGEGPYWHMIGHVQSNKVKYLPRLFRWIHSIDRQETLRVLDRYGDEVQVLFEVNIAGEESKHGTSEDGLRRILETVDTLSHVRPCGLMTMPPMVAGPEEGRTIFVKLRTLLEQVNREFGLAMRELSMGMSQDFEVAIEEGATIVRIGTAIFGERP
jgi:PLP dependent protein